MTAKEYALRALDRRDYSARELTRKLLDKGYEEAEAVAAVERLMELGFVFMNCPLRMTSWMD